MGHWASGIGHRASGIGHYELLITYYQLSIVTHLSEKSYTYQFTLKITKKGKHLNNMDIKNGFVGTIGNTPLIRLNSFSDETGCEILGKAEFLNPGGSVKDRAALYIIKDAEEKGLLKPGGTVVEGTAGNTGIGLAHICNAKGYKCLIVIPDTQSQEKIDALKTLGAEVRTVPALPYKDPNNYVKLSGRLAAEMENAVVTVLCDGGARYQSRLFDRQWLTSKGLSPN